MSGNSFRSVFMVASCAGAALGCYLVSLRVASERAALEQVETQIVLAERDIRLLQTEIGTRGRLAQLERWNVKVLALSAPSAEQFVGTGFELARMVAPQQRKVDLEAPVVLAAAPAGAPRPRVKSSEPQQQAAPQLLHTASLKRTLPEPRAVEPARPAPAVAAPTPAEKKLASLTGKPAAKKVVDKPAAETSRTVTSAAKIAKPDPLAPLPKMSSSKAAKDSRTTP